jgi:hypothetical protein
MTRLTTKTTGIAALLFCMAISSCGTTSKMGISPDLKTDAAEFDVKGRNGVMVKQKLSFGPYTTGFVKRSWVTARNDAYGASTGTPGSPDYRNIINAEHIRKKQTVSFSLSDGAQQATAYCATKFNADGLQIGPYKNSVLNTGLQVWNWLQTENLFYVQVYTDSNEKPWELLLDNRAAQGASKKYTGVFAKSENEYYTIRPATQIEQKGQVRQMPFGSVGFEILDKEGMAVAAVSRMEKGMVYLGNAPQKEKLLLATLCTALLLQENIG